MRCLVGQYLVTTSAGSQYIDDQWQNWFGFWAIHASSEGDSFDWRIVDRGQTTEQFADQALAQAQADRSALEHARRLQSDDTLEPLPLGN